MESKDYFIFYLTANQASLVRKKMWIILSFLESSSLRKSKVDIKAYSLGSYSIYRIDICRFLLCKTNNNNQVNYNMKRSN